MASSYCKPCACNAAKKRLKAIENATDKLPFAQAAYDQANGHPVSDIAGFKNITEDPAALAKYGLTPADLTIPDTKFQAVVFEKGNQLITAFKGTDPLSLSDWQANLEQGAGLESQYYTRAQEIAKTIQSNLPPGAAPPEFVGHSLGGGLASAAAAAIDAPATTFNAAGLNARNIADGVVARNVEAVKVRGEILTGFVNRLPGTPDVFASDVTMIDPPPSFGRDVVLPVLGQALGSTPELAGALAVRGVLLHLTGAIHDSLVYETQKAQTAVAAACN
jgi:hypothetical protein